MFGEITGSQLIAAVLAFADQPHPCPVCGMFILGRCIVCERESKGLSNHFGFTVREVRTFDTTAGHNTHQGRAIKAAHMVKPIY